MGMFEQEVLTSPFMRSARDLLLTACLASFATQAVAGTVRLELVLARSSPVTTQPSSVELRAEPRAREGSPGGNERPDGLAFDLEAPGESELDLGPGIWDLTVEAQGLWAAPTSVEVAEPVVSTKLELWRTGELRAAAAAAENEDAPTALVVQFQPAPSGRDQPTGTAECVVRDELWSCEVPATTLDLRFQSPGWVQQYRWDVRVPAGGTRSLGELRFHRGAAVIGWVVAEGERAVDDTRVHLTPRSVVQHRSSVSGARIETMRLAAVTNSRGFFQIEGVPPGEYVLEAYKEPFAPTRVSVRVLRDQVTEVSDPPLVLREPQAVEIFVDPPLTPNGDRWRALWMQIDKGSSAIASQLEFEIPESGAWKLEDVPPARYLLTLGPAGSEQRWYQEEIEVGEAQPALFVTLPVTAVRGSVSFGDDPIAAELFFGRENGPVAVALAADAEGRFEGYLPREGMWELDVVSEEPAVRRSFQNVEVVQRAGKSWAELELRLPKTALRGVVVDEASILAADAIVTVQSLDEVVAAVRMKSDDTGEFEVLGLPPGRTSVIAEDTRGREQLYSQEVEVELDDDGTPSKVRLVLRPELRIRGRVVDGDRGVPGARIKAEPVQLHGLPLFPEISDAQGFFEVHVPSQTRELVLSVGAPGFAFRFLRLPASVEEPVVVPVSQTSGTLRIRLPEELDRTLWSSPDLYLHHGGATESLGYLLSWASFNDQLPPDDGLIVLPRMEPGDYVACLLPFGERFANAQSAPEDRRCTGGYLPAAGELEIFF